jgi:hypothetical protein
MIFLFYLYINKEVFKELIFLLILSFKSKLFPSKIYILIELIPIEKNSLIWHEIRFSQFFVLTSFYDSKIKKEFLFY